jgi:ATP-dependent Zn protease
LQRENLTRSVKSIERTAYHEAGHAVLAHFLGVGLKHVSIIANEDSSGHILDGGEFSEETEEMRHHAEEAFWLCMAIVRYAGAEAERRLTQRRRNTGAKNDYKWAAIALEKITMDWPSRRALYFYARRRAGCS